MSQFSIIHPSCKVSLQFEALMLHLWLLERTFHWCQNHHESKSNTTSFETKRSVNFIFEIEDKFASNVPWVFTSAIATNSQIPQERKLLNSEIADLSQYSRSELDIAVSQVNRVLGSLWMQVWKRKKMFNQIINPTFFFKTNNDIISEDMMNRWCVIIKIVSGRNSVSSNNKIRICSRLVSMCIQTLISSRRGIITSSSTSICYRSHRLCNMASERWRSRSRRYSTGIREINVIKDWQLSTSFWCWKSFQATLVVSIKVSTFTNCPRISDKIN